MDFNLNLKISAIFTEKINVLKSIKNWFLKSISFKNDLRNSEATKIYMILPLSIVIVLICTTTYKAIFKCKISSFDSLWGCLRPLPLICHALLPKKHPKSYFFSFLSMILHILHWHECSNFTWGCVRPLPMGGRGRAHPMCRWNIQVYAKMCKFIFKT